MGSVEPVDLPGLPVLSVAELVRRIRQTLAADELLQNVLVQGEISNFRRQGSGHLYFTLKDSQGRLRCVMFRSAAVRLTFEPADGLAVLALGSVGFYELGGDCQLYVEQLYPAGTGALYLAFQQLKDKLAAEGLFDPAHKRPLPFLPRRIALITSPTGAAVRDMITVSQRRFPGLALLVIPAVVQGEEGPASVIQALEWANQQPDVDLIILGRGGGSLEELWTFNDERVARAIFASRLPVVSAVGHETDFTIADFVADRRAPTPSAAAEIAVPSRDQLERDVQALVARMQSACQAGIRRRRQAWEHVAAAAAFRRPQDRLRRYAQRVDELAADLERQVQERLRQTRDRADRAAQSLARWAGSGTWRRRQAWEHLKLRLQQAGKTMLSRPRARLAEQAAKLSALSPLATLARGYAVCRQWDGTVVRRWQQVAVGDAVEVLLAVGRLDCRVEGSGPSFPDAAESGSSPVAPPAGSGERPGAGFRPAQASSRPGRRRARNAAIPLQCSLWSGTIAGEAGAHPGGGPQEGERQNRDGHQGDSGNEA